MQFVLAARLDLGRQAGDRLQQGADDGGDHEQKHRHHYQQRQNRSRRAVPGQLVTRSRFLGDGKALALRHFGDQDAIRRGWQYKRLRAVGQRNGQRERGRALEMGGSFRQHLYDQPGFRVGHSNPVTSSSPVC